MQSPYIDKPASEWRSITEKLVSQIPLTTEEIIKIVFESWDCIFQSKICGLEIGIDIFPSPQMMGYFLETAIAANISKKYPAIWKHGKGKEEKDIVCLKNPDYSIEIKTSSSKKEIYGNRSYAQPQSDSARKSKDSFYLAVNFEQPKIHKTEISLIRFGYLEHSDWIPQTSETGQQARLSAETYQGKFIVLYEKEKN